MQVNQGMQPAEQSKACKGGKCDNTGRLPARRLGARKCRVQSAQSAQKVQEVHKVQNSIGRERGVGVGETHLNKRER